jgi:thioredoxin-related protein
MTRLLLLIISILLMSASWRTDFERAKTDARKEHKLVLLKFSGSDWCVPCIWMEADVFSDTSFCHFAANHLEMVNADFPRDKRHKLDDMLTKQNEALAERYNKEGHFPYTVLLDATGNVLKAWDGYNGEKAEMIVEQIKSYAGNF